MVVRLELALDALFIAIDKMLFWKAHGLAPGMSCRGNFYNNAAAEPFFDQLGTGRVICRVYRTRLE